MLEEIEVNDNPLGIKVYVNGIPDINKMPEKEFDLFVSSLELRMSAILLRLTESFVSMRKKNQAAGKAAKPINVISTENASAAQAQSMAQRAMVERV